MALAFDYEAGYNLGFKRGFKHGRRMVRTSERERVLREAIRIVENTPVIISRIGVSRGSDLNGWGSAVYQIKRALSAAIKAEGNQ